MPGTINFVFDVTSQHTFTAPQSVIISADQTLGTVFGWYSSITTNPSEDAPAVSYYPCTNRVRSQSGNPNKMGNLQACKNFASHEGSGTCNRLYATLSSITFAAGSGESVVLAGAHVAEFNLNETRTATIYGNYISGSIAAGKNAARINGYWLAMAGIAGTITDFYLYGGSMPPRAKVSGQYWAFYTANLGNTQVSGPVMSRQTFSNAPATMTEFSAYIAQTGNLTANQTVTLVPANSVPAGRVVLVADESGTCNGAAQIVVTAAGADTINGAATSAIIIAYGYRRFVSDGVSKWTVCG